MFVTNGGGILEAEKARLLSSKLGLQVDAQQLVLCHTPVRQLVHRFGKQRVLCVGGPGVPGVARAYGFQDVASVADVIADDPRRYPLWKRARWRRLPCQATATRSLVQSLCSMTLKTGALTCR